VKEFARGLHLELWYSCNVTPDDANVEKNGIPSILQDYADILDIIIDLEPKQDFCSV